MSDSVRPHRQQPTRLPRPWDSPGKNPGVGCHFLLHCMKVKSESEVTQSCPTLSDPVDCSLPGSSVHGVFQTRVLEWGAIVSSDVRHRISHLQNLNKQRNKLINTENRLTDWEGVKWGKGVKGRKEKTIPYYIHNTT